MKSTNLYLLTLLTIIMSACSGSNDQALEKELDGSWQSQYETRGDEGFEMTSRTVYDFHYEPDTDINEYPVTQTLMGAMKIKEGRDSLPIDFTASIDGTYYVKDNQLGIDYDTETISCKLKCDNPRFGLIKRDLESTFRLTLLEMIKSNNGNIHFPSFSIDRDTLYATDFQGSAITLTRTQRPH